MADVLDVSSEKVSPLTKKLSKILENNLENDKVIGIFVYLAWFSPRFVNLLIIYGLVGYTGSHEGVVYIFHWK